MASLPPIGDVTATWKPTIGVAEAFGTLQLRAAHGAPTRLNAFAGESISRNIGKRADAAGLDRADSLRTPRRHRQAPHSHLQLCRNATGRAPQPIRENSTGYSSCAHSGVFRVASTRRAADCGSHKAGTSLLTD